MSARTLLEVDCQTVKLATKTIEEIIECKQLKCGKCSNLIDILQSSLKSSQKHKSQLNSQFLCNLCIEKQYQNCGGFELISVGFVYEIMKCFKMFDMNKINKSITDKIFDEINGRKDLKQFQKKQIVQQIQPYISHTFENRFETSFTSFETKIKTISYFIIEFVKQIKENEAIKEWFSEENRSHKLSEDQIAYLLRIMREQIALKLESLKMVYKIINTNLQHKNITRFSRSALSLLYQPLRSFLKTQSSNNVIYSLNRREITLKYFQNQKTQEQYVQTQELVRLNEPLRSKPVVFRLKCPYKSERLRIGFFFMNSQDYEAQEEYQKPFQPLQIVFNVHSYLQDDSKHQISSQTQRADPEMVKHNMILFNQRRQKRIKMCLNTSQSYSEKEKKFAMSFKKDAKNIESKEFDVEDDTLVELKYQKSSNTVSIKNLSKGATLYRRRFYRRSGFDTNKIVIFPCVVLTGPYCSVEYILTD